MFATTSIMFATPTGKFAKSLKKFATTMGQVNANNNTCLFSTCQQQPQPMMFVIVAQECLQQQSTGMFATTFGNLPTQGSM